VQCSAVQCIFRAPGSPRACRAHRCCWSTGPQTDTDGGLAADVPQARFADAGASPPVCWRGDADDDQRVADEILGAQLQQAPQGEATDRLADPHGGPITCSINLATTPADTVRALVLVPAPAVYA
jgi:hypothetical protein